MSEAKSQSVHVGFVMFVSTMVLIVGLFVVGGRGGLEKKVHYSFLVKSAQNVRPGTRVDLDGVTVGQVSSVEFQTARDQKSDPRNIVIEIGIRKSSQHRIREGTVVFLQSAGLLGDQVVAMESGGFELPLLPPGSELKFQERTMVDGIIGKETRDNADALLTQLIEVLESLQSEEGTIGRFLKDESFYAHADGVVENAERTLGATAEILEKMQTGETPLAELFLGADEAKSLTRSIAALEALTTELENDRELSQALRRDLPQAMARLESVLQKIDDGVGTLGRLVNDPTIADNLNNVFLGVREEGMILNLIRNAERGGQKIYADAVSRREEEARIREAIAERARAEGAVQPASGELISEEGSQ